MAAYIYSIRNMITRVCYVGSTVRPLAVRFSEHKYSLKAGTHHSPRLQAAWNKHGPDTFEFVLVERCHKDVLIESEQFWIDRLRSFYNYAPAAGSVAGLPKTEEHKAKIGKGNKGKRRTSEQKAYIRSQIMASPKHKCVMSDEDKQLRKNKLTERYKDKELRAKISALVRAAHLRDPSIVSRVAAANRGKKRTDETRRLMSESARRARRPK